MRESIARRAALGTGVLVVGAVTLFAALQQRDTVGMAAPVPVPAQPTSLPEAVPEAAPGAPPREVVAPTVPPVDAVPPPDAPATPSDAAPPPGTPGPGAMVPVEPAAPASQAAPSSVVLALGERVYGEQRCAACHSIAGVGSPRSPLDGVGGRLTAAEIRLWIVDPQAMRPGIRKPAFDDLPAEEVEALVAFIQSLR